MRPARGPAAADRSAGAEPRALTEAYDRCRRLHRREGRTYYLATLLLPRWKRRHVHALYGFARQADEIVDEIGTPPATSPTRAERAAALHLLGERLFAGLDGAPVEDPLLPAVVHTVRAFDLDRADFGRFLGSMAMDLEVRSYRTYEDLLGYMDGSGAAIGTMLLPILEPSDPAAAREPARQLGLAFQLTNFIRDVAEDLRRDRLYLPTEDLERFGLRRSGLATGGATPAFRALIQFEIERARCHYRLAAPGIELLAPSSRACVGTAFRLYQEILDQIERAGHDVLRRRARVPIARRLTVATQQRWAAHP